jgi:hypothetical protein
MYVELLNVSNLETARNRKYSFEKATDHKRSDNETA